MKKLTAGIFASLLAVVATGAAHAEIASKGYVDDINKALTSAIGAKADTTTVTALDGRVEAAEGEIDTIQGTMETYGDVVTHNASEFATAAQGTKADTAVQPAAISDMQVKTNMVNTAGWATGKTDDTKYPSAAAVNTAITAATENIASSDTVEQIQSDLDAAEADIAELQTDKQDKNMGAEAANHIVTTDGTGNITSAATIANTQVSGLGTLATKSTVTSADITDGTIAEGDLNASINASLDKADTALQQADLDDYVTETDANAAYAAKTLEGQVGAVSAENMGTTATTVVTAIKEVAGEAAAAQSTATGAQSAVDAVESTIGGYGDIVTHNASEFATTTALTSGLAGKLDSDATAARATADASGNVITTTYATKEEIAGMATDANLALKQDKTDNSLATTNKTVVGAINEVKTTADGANTAAGAAQDAADAAQEAADAAQATANAAIPAPTDACADSENKCVLVSSGAGNYSWEVIARGGAE
ncbi:MAG: hypothetical protein IAC69_01290 [Proteobacteria bacterium]|uniref:Uncharacterized protein n=1 Tax=Candidatus Enterousia avistercoris TaxID=2840788 RepID=A0A9D9DCC1_9PROT|nr:hypothetical protein [Candidatus Enterousia avistercoris]